MALFAPLALLLVCAAGPAVTEDQVARVWEKFRELEQKGFTPESMVELYQLENAAAAVKKLVDAHQSNPQRAIAPEASAKLEATRQAMNLEVLKQLAKANGGRIEVLNFGKMNGIRSDKDQTIYGMDGRIIRTAEEMKEAYAEVFKTRFGIDMGRLDMAMFDGDAFIPDWRKAQSGYYEFIHQFKKGQAKLESNPEAYREAGAYRAQVDRRSFEAGMVTIIEYDAESGEFKIIENAPAKEQSSRYAKWERHKTARNATGAVYENLQRFRHSADFIDRMKYFNRTVGDGMVGLTGHWKHDYVFHVNALRDKPGGEAEIRKMIGDIVQANFRDAPEGQRALMARVMEAAALVESDKMRNQTRSIGEYMKPFADLVPEAERGKLAGAELEDRCRQLFHEAQQDMMKRGLVSVTQEKLRRDWTKQGLKVVQQQNGPDAARKLRWETANEIKRVIHGLDGDPELVQKIIDAAPAEVRPKLQAMHNAHQARIARAKAGQANLVLEKPDPAKARTTGPEEREALAPRVAQDLEAVKQHFAGEMADIRKRYGDQWTRFKAELDSGAYSDEAISQKVRERVMEAFSLEERQVFNKLKNDYETRVAVDKRQFLNNLLDLGNADSLLNVIKAYQQSNGDINTVGMAVLWELVSKAPGVSQLATLKQSLHDGSYENLWWLFVAWRSPGTAHVKMIFDVAKGTMEVLYDHAMTPLKNDRFAQVYMGFVDAQPAGWSPLVPGWKERRDAHQMSILSFVPGETFSQKRSHMYRYFLVILDGKLRQRGYEPTDDAYWEKLHEITPAFFGRYVQDYFDAKGDWSDNTTAGLRALGELPNLKQRMVNQLVQDFRSGQDLDWQGELAREQFDEALRDAQAMARQRISAEREAEIAEDFLGDLVGQDHAAALEGLEPDAEPEEMRVAAEAYPPVVRENQEARFVVKLEGPGAAEAAERYDVELMRTGGQSLLSGETSVSPERVREVAGDPVLAAPIAANPDLDKTRLHAARLDYDAVVTDRQTGRTVRQPINIRLFGLEEPSPLERRDFAEVMLGRVADLTLPDGTKTKGREYLPLDDPLGAPWVIDRKLYLLIRWADCPVDKYFHARYRVTGAHPAIDQAVDVGEIGMTGFGPDAKRGGNCFSLTLPLDFEYGGTFRAAGELLAFQWAELFEEQGKGEPVARRPFDVSFTTPDMQYEGEGRVFLQSNSHCSAEFSFQRLQRGQRVATVQIAGVTRYAMLGGGARVEAWDVDRPPTSLTVTFPDYGKERTITIPLKEAVVEARTGPNAELAASHQRNLEIYRRAEEENLVMIAEEYRSMAADHVYHDLGKMDAYMEQAFDYHRRADAALKDPNWAGYRKHYGPHDDAAKQRKTREHVEADLRRRISGFEVFAWDNRVSAAADRQDLDRLSRYLPMLEEAAKRDPAGSPPHHWTAKMAEYWSRISELRFQFRGDLEGAHQAYVRSESLRKESEEAAGGRYSARRFPFRPDPGFGQPDPGPDVQ